MTNQQEQELRRQQEQEDLKHLLSQPEGLRVLRRIVKQSGVLTSSYAVNDSLATAHNEGLRSVGLWLLAEVERADHNQLTNILGVEHA